MINYAIRSILTGILVFIMPKILSGLVVDSIETGIIVAFVMSILNTFVKPILKFISFPINVLTLGLFSLVITVVLVYICEYLVDGFHVDGFLTALIFGILLSIGNSIIDTIVK